jgi:hypothetical protein
LVTAISSGRIGTVTFVTAIPSGRVVAVTFITAIPSGWISIASGWIGFVTLILHWDLLLLAGLRVDLFNFHNLTGLFVDGL